MRQYLLPLLMFGGCNSCAPVEVTFRQSLLDEAGLVLQVHNTSDGHLSCVMEAENNLQKQSVSHSFSLAPYEDMELGIIETGWSFRTGESVVVKCEGKIPYTTTVP